MKPTTQDLPGFDLADLIRKSDDIADLSEEKNYTAERLFVHYPDRYNIARGLFFEIGLSKRAICEICKLNSRTLNALIEREMSTRGAEFLFEKVRRKKALIAYQLTEQLEELSHDAKACKEAGINGLIQAIKLIQESTGMTIDADSTSSNTSAENPISCEYVKVFKLSSLSKNGLDSQKNLSPRDQSNQPGKTIDAAEAESAPTASDSPSCSIPPSNGE